ncbi:hypothetical protein SEA_HORUS_51 [Gordonia phage Horus]|uniref:Preprotein translocase subunit SecB n=1 Tax=Gordonia phage Horus TaxID=2301696 RepID=A0A385DWP9_9CAUD|nr:hypothetical protein HOT93_gp099 [Gordonia phage Horus]AXQ63903.1 hypothetical protein SEA_HORUS_51 [Gordonia phage Horus]
MTEKSFDDVHTLLLSSELTDVIFHEVAASRTTEEPSSHYTLQVLTRVDGTQFEVRCKTTVVGGGAKYLGDAGAIFTLAEERKIPDEVAQEFAEKVGVMAVYPYLRAAITQLGAQLAVERPVLPLLRSGDVQLTADEPWNATPAEKQ